MMSGPRAEKFVEGWALPALSWGHAHYYRREGLALAYPVCGGKPVAAGRVFFAGDWTRCELCVAKLSGISRRERAGR